MWQTKSLKELCSIFADGDWIEKKDQSVAGIRLVQTGNIKMGYFAERQDKARYISEGTFNRLNCTEIKRGDILVSRLPEPVGRATIIPELKDKAITAVDCTIIRLKEEILPSYLNYYMQSPQYLSSIQLKVTGATRQRISRKNLGEIPITFPPLAEQERIVAKLDAAFAEIDEAVEVLSNKLISCESLLVKSISEEFAVPKAEHNIKFADVCELKRGYDLPKRQRRSGNFPLFSANGITDYIYESKVEAPGVVTGRSGTIGAVHYTDEDFWPLNTALYVRDFKGNLPRYIFYFLKSFNLKSFSSGAGVPTLNRNVLSAELVNINRKKEEQRRTINKLDSVINKIEELKITFKEQENNYIALKSAILSQELNSSEAA